MELDVAMNLDQNWKGEKSFISSITDTNEENCVSFLIHLLENSVYGFPSCWKEPSVPAQHSETITRQTEWERQTDKGSER